MGLDELGQEPLTASMLACAGCGNDLSDKESDGSQSSARMEEPIEISWEKE